MNIVGKSNIYKSSKAKKIETLIGKKKKNNNE